MAVSSGVGAGGVVGVSFVGFTRVQSSRVPVTTAGSRLAVGSGIDPVAPTDRNRIVTIYQARVW
ncbi:hypothetical protein GCM10009809_29080 [Isoptericola hypogeus]|uniref:Uncharacterized protein n=1 Tax=Isoptericola hypogeus TaxID=300179 RepID=A0ABN2JM11_9MICO